jgi:hypothetical protein
MVVIQSLSRMTRWLALHVIKSSRRLIFKTNCWSPTFWTLRKANLQCVTYVLSVLRLTLLQPHLGTNYMHTYLGIQKDRTSSGFWMVVQALVRMVERYGYLSSSCRLHGMTAETIREVVRQIQFEGTTRGLSRTMVSPIFQLLRLPRLELINDSDWRTPKMSHPDAKEITSTFETASCDIGQHGASGAGNTEIQPFPHPPTVEVKRVVLTISF